MAAVGLNTVAPQLVDWALRFFARPLAAQSAEDVSFPPAAGYPEESATDADAESGPA